MKMTLSLSAEDIECAIADYVYKIKKVVITGKPHSNLSDFNIEVTVDVEEPKPSFSEDR